MVSKKYNDTCPQDVQIIDSISGKWTVMVVYTLAQKPYRNGELKRAIAGISHKVLTQTLRKLERDGIVSRKVYPVVPPQVEYSLTPLGKSLVQVLCNLHIWTKENYKEVLKAQESYDTTHHLHDKIGG